MNKHRGLRAGSGRGVVGKGGGDSVWFLLCYHIPHKSKCIINIDINNKTVKIKGAWGFRIFRTDKLSFSRDLGAGDELYKAGFSIMGYSWRSWRDSCAQGTFWPRRRQAKRAAKPQGIFASGEAARENPTLLAAPPPKQYSTLTLIPPATLATWDMALLRTMILPKILFSRV